MNPTMDPETSFKILQSLKSSVADLAAEDPYLKDDIYLLQWLRAKKMNAQDAEASIRARFAWKKELNVESLEHEEFPEPLSRHFPLHFSFDANKKGVPVCYGKEDEVGWIGLIKLYGQQKVMHYFIYRASQVEKELTEFNRKKNSNLNAAELTPDSVCGLMAIFDGEGYGLKHVSSIKVLQFYYNVALTYVRYFPHLASSLYYINSNKFNRIGLRMVKPLLEGLLDEVRVYGDESTWSKDVFSFIEPEDLRKLMHSQETTPAVSAK